jgi:uncharacterized protein DUF4349
MTTFRNLALGLAALAVLATGCSGGEADGDAGATTEAAEREFADTGSAAEAPDAAGGGGTQNGRRAQTAADLVRERAVISTGVVSLLSTDAGDTRADVQKIVDVHRGEVTDEETTTDADGGIERSRLVVRVPAADFYQTVEELEDVAELESSTKSSEDVTTQVIDTEVRIRAQERSLRRIELLLARAQSIRDIVNIESELTRRQAELDSLKSQQAFLEDQTTMSTITVHIEQKKGEREKPGTDESGFLAGLDGGWRALRVFATVLAMIAGALLPWAVVLGLLGAPTWLIARRVARRRPVVTAPREG